jgi:hypothetical protein
LQEAFNMQTRSKSDEQIQGHAFSDWHEAAVRKPETRAGQIIVRRHHIHPSIADLIAALAGLGSEGSGT